MSDSMDRQGDIQLLRNMRERAIDKRNRADLSDFFDEACGTSGMNEMIGEVVGSKPPTKNEPLAKRHRWWMWWKR